MTFQSAIEFMATDNEHLVERLRRDPLRHITPLKMYALYGAAMRVLPVDGSPGANHSEALVLVSPRSVSQYDEANYGDVEWVVMPALPAHPTRDLVATCAEQILAATGRSSFVVKTVEVALVDALRERLGSKRAPQYRRALCTFGWPGGRFCGSPDASVVTTSTLQDEALPLLRAHGVYSMGELQTLFADGSARCHLKFAVSADGSKDAVSVLLTFPNAPAIHEIGSLHVRPDARRAGHARALLVSALTDLQVRELTVRYVVDATNAPSIALAEAVGLREQFRLAHWVVGPA